MAADPRRARLSAILNTREGVLVRRLLLVLGAYITLRAVFLVDHYPQYRDESALALLRAFAQGIRFDLSAIVYTNVPFIVLSLAPAALYVQRWYQRLLFALFAVVNGALALIMTADIAYYPFTGTRLTADVFALSGEAASQLDQWLVNYLGLLVVAVAVTAGLVFLYPRHGYAMRSEAVRQAAPVRPRSWPLRAAAVVAVLVLCVLGARGGVQKKPLKPIHAFAGGQHDIGVLTLNSAFTLLHSTRDQRLQPVAFFSSDSEAESIIRAPYGYAERAGGSTPAQPQNVMLIILESYGTEFWGGTDREFTLTPFLDSLAAHGTFFTNNFANGRRSMDALPSILLGVPRYTGQSIAVSGYQANQWLGLGHFLEEAGYHTSMFHGAVKGTMYFDAIANMSGIRDFYPLERYPAELRGRDFDDHWGLYDEPWLQFAARELTTHREPFFTTIFTISTHQPYRVPAEYEQQLPGGTKPIHRSVAYVDLALRRFFETARTQPWYDNTLFIITGDHTPPIHSRRYDTALGRYMVPLLLYHPTRALPEVDPARITQHVDIFATVLDYSGARPQRVPAFGRSVFSDVPGEAVLTTDDIFWIVRQEGVVERTPAGAERFLAYRQEATGSEAGPASSELARELSLRLLANLQYFSMSMINNSFYREPADVADRASGADRRPVAGPPL